ncbi:MAG: CDP-glucose 4,6-dehydratase [Acidobacteriota bacterium]
MTRETFWRGRRVLVTGHTGFKGSWLCLWLRRLGAEVTGFALEPPSTPNLFEAADLASDIDSIHGDVRDFEAVTGVFERSSPEIVLHLAAQSLVRPSYDDPVATYATNVMGTVHVLEAARRVPGVRALLVVTSDKCYENREWLWPYRENEALGGHDPYSSSKGCAELVTTAFHRSFFADSQTRVASARAGNVVGGGDWAVDRLIPDLVRGMVAGEPIHIRNPGAVRPWQHVLEALEGYLALVERLWDSGDFTGGWNFGPRQDDARSVAWIVERLIGRWHGLTGETLPWSRDGGPHPHEAGLLRLDTTKAREGLGWRPRLNLGTCLDWIVDWTLAYRDGRPVKDLCLEQIQRFEELAP